MQYIKASNFPVFWGIEEACKLENLELILDQSPFFQKLQSDFFLKLDRRFGVKLASLDVIGTNTITIPQDYTISREVAKFVTQFDMIAK